MVKPIVPDNFYSMSFPQKRESKKNIYTCHCKEALLRGYLIVIARSVATWQSFLNFMRLLRRHKCLLAMTGIGSTGLHL
nr:hypothetical protein [Rickettsia felis]